MSFIQENGPFWGGAGLVWPGPNKGIIRRSFFGSSQSMDLTLVWPGSAVHCTLYTVHCTLYTVHCTLYTVHCTLYTVHQKSVLFGVLVPHDGCRNMTNTIQNNVIQFNDIQCPQKDHFVYRENRHKPTQVTKSANKPWKQASSMQNLIDFYSREGGYLYFT